MGVRRYLKKMLELCKNVEDENLRIIKIFRCDNIVFEKRKIHYATVSTRLERALSNYFKQRIYVTSRSERTIKLLAEG